MTLETKQASVGAILVVGGGVGGMRAAVDAAEVGLKVYLLEKDPWLGGRVAQLGYMFPTHDCVLCRGTADHGYGCTKPTISPALLDFNLHPNIEILNNSDLIHIKGRAGNFTVTVRRRPTYVNAERCINCGICTAVCPVSLPSVYEEQLKPRKAIYKMSPRAVPNTYVVDKVPRCETCRRCEDVCPTGAVNLDESEYEQDLHVGAVILSLGFSLSNPDEYGELGHGRYPNVIHSMEYERLASRSGPTEGVVMRPSDGETPKRIAWLQCIGSRDQKYPFCSSICCMYATKEAMVAKQRLGDVQCQIFMMDERAFNKEFNAYYHQAKEQYEIEYTRCRISAVKEDPETQDLILSYPDEKGHMQEERFGMVVLSLGAHPPNGSSDLAKVLGIELNPYGFCETDKFAPLSTSKPGIYVCGTFASPKEIAETILDAAGAVGDATRLIRDRIGELPSSREYPFMWKPNNMPPERDVSGEEPRVGVFLCRCTPTLDGVVDVDAVARFAAGMPNVVHVEPVEYGCFPEGMDAIKAGIEAHGLNRVVVAACSHRTHEPLFQRTVREAGLNPYLLEMINVREHCAWAHVDDPAGATRKAKELVRMGLGRVLKAEPVYKQALQPVPRALVIGGGVAGMTAALNIADAGYDVTLVERDSELGGNLRNVYYVAEGDNPQRLLRDLINRIIGDERIVVLTETDLVSHAGRVGDFRSVLRTHHAGEDVVETEVAHGVTIVATGGKEWRGDVYMLGRDPRVVTSEDLEDIIAHRPEEITGLKQVVFIQCVREPGSVEYCSRVCCTNTMKNAIRIKMLNSNCQIVVLYQDIITYGFREAYYTEARNRGVIFMRYDEGHMPELNTVDGKLEMKLWEPSLGREITLNPDLLALSTAITPSPGTEQLAEILDVPISSEGFFMEAHLKMRPMDFISEGIFICGMAHYPKFIEDAIVNAQATAARALTILSKDRLYIGGVIAVVDQSRCVGCLTCVRTCPFEIPKIRYEDLGVGEIKGAAYIEPGLCQGCGTCVSECPAKAIELLSYRDEQILAQSLGSWCVESAEPVGAADIVVEGGRDE
ncbi:MAG: CoB--CoM heterodisulfide reductase iron-sulfur subunit A family protein [Anaerolineae bacterium]|nr:CoB--CoM heterodisulfide reductase iron-sulfur subunit A family protein [Anaerolineae bacterium]